MKTFMEKAEFLKIYSNLVLNVLRKQCILIGCL